MPRIADIANQRGIKSTESVGKKVRRADRPANESRKPAASTPTAITFQMRLQLTSRGSANGKSCRTWISGECMLPES